MGCSFETAKQSSGLNNTFDSRCHTTITTTTTTAARTRNFYGTKTAKPQNPIIINTNATTTNCNNNSNSNNPTKDTSNDDCQQQQKPATTKAKKTQTTTTASQIYNCISSNCNNDTSNSVKDEFKRKSNFYSLEAKEYTNSPTDTSNFQAVEQEGVVLQESCINCYPLACHNRICCKQEKSPSTADTRHSFDTPNYCGSSSNSGNINNNNCCCCNNCCHCLVSYFCQKHRNTLRNDHQGERNGCQSKTDGPGPGTLDPYPQICAAGGRCLQKTLSHASSSLTSSALDLKNTLVEVIGGNCATLVESLMQSTIRQCMTHCSNSNINNNNKSEPYRGYCQRKPTSASEYIPTYTSTNSCSLHDAISSTHHRQQQHNNINIKSNNSSRCSNNNHNCHATAAATTHAAAFNYIGHNYYHLLRNSINFYTASSVILVLCYLTTTTSAATTKSESTSVDKHPIFSKAIDWSKFDESSSDKEILDMLLEKKRYDKRLLPPVNDEDFCCGLSSPDMATEQTRRPHRRGTLTVNVNVLLLSLASPDESSLKYEVEFLLHQQWNDPRLEYGNKSQYPFLNALHHHDSIWTPDTYFIMHGDFKDPIIPMHFALRIFRNGTIMYAMRRHLILSCQGSLHIFPFDDPKCSFSMESISYEESQIKYVWRNDEDTLRKSPSLTTLNAYLIKNQTTPCDQNSWRGNYSCLRVDLIFTRDRAFYFTTVFIPGIILVTSSFITFWLEWNAVPARSMIGNYSCLQVELTFTRDRAYYFTTVFIPGIILVTSSFITFWLEWNAVPARVMIGVTTMLNFFTTSNGFRSTLPVVSNLTAMNVWDGVCMCFIYASLLEFVCVNYMGRKRPQHNVVYRPGENPVTQRLPAVLSRIGVILASPLEIIEREFNAAMSSEKAAAGIPSTGTSIGVTPRPSSPASEQPSRVHFELEGGIIASAVQSLRARSIKRRNVKDVTQGWKEREATTEQITRVYEHVYAEPGGVTTFSAAPTVKTTTLTIETDITDDAVEMPPLRRTQSMSTNTPALVMKGVDSKVAEAEVSTNGEVTKSKIEPTSAAGEEHVKLDMPVKPPRKKTSRSTSPASQQYEALQSAFNEMAEAAGSTTTGEKKRDAGGPNEIVACTTCGGNSGSPCTHSANNGCATETCFVQVRKKEPPHPIRIAKTIDVIARITFPTAYAIFLIFFFVHYKGFS